MEQRSQAKIFLQRYTREKNLRRKTTNAKEWAQKRQCRRVTAKRDFRRGTAEAGPEKSR